MSIEQHPYKNPYYFDDSELSYVEVQTLDPTDPILVELNEAFTGEVVVSGEEWEKLFIETQRKRVSRYAADIIPTEEVLVELDVIFEKRNVFEAEQQQAATLRLEAILDDTDMQIDLNELLGLAGY